MNYRNEMAVALRNPELWLEQVKNIIRTLLWAAGTWLVLTGSLFGFFVAVFVATTDAASFAVTELLEVVVTIFKFTGVIVAGVVILGGTPKKLINVFHQRTQSRIDRADEIKRRIESNIELTETLLLRYGLLQPEDIQKRKNNLPPGELL